MKTFLVTLIFLTSILFAQIDTVDCLSYFPIAIGNQYQYRTSGYSGIDSINTIEITGDTLMPNGNTYYIFDQFDLFNHNAEYFRIDTASLKVYRYQVDIETECNSEILHFDLHPQMAYEDTINTCLSYRITKYSGSGNVGELFIQRSNYSYVWYYMIGEGYVLSKGIGISSYEFEEVIGVTSNLIAAKINNEYYGEFVNINDEPFTPKEFKILSVYPNPFNNSTTISFSVDNPSFLNIFSYDITGRVVQKSDIRIKSVGIFSASLSFSDLSSGIYIVSIVNGDLVESRKVLLLK